MIAFLFLSFDTAMLISTPTSLRINAHLGEKLLPVLNT